VTFVVGIKCKDGLVLCSDSLETDGYNKKFVQKLFKYEVNDKWGLAFGCSGTSAACTNFGDRLLELMKDARVYDRRGTEKLIEATMGYMKDQYPQETLDVVLGLWANDPNETRLYKAHTSTQCLSVEPTYACAGMDVSLGRFLLDSILEGDNIKTKEAVHIAPFVTSVVKEKADGVGGPTQMLFHAKGHPVWLEAHKPSVAEIEKRQFPFADLEKSIRQFCWSRFPHEFKPQDDDYLKELDE